MKKLLIGLLVTFTAGCGVVIVATQVSADKQQPIPSSTTDVTYDADANLLVSTIDEHTIEISEPD